MPREKRMPFISVTINVRVYDATALKKAAAARALKDGIDIRHWRKIRTGAGCDLQMLLDPGESPPGCSIEDSTVETE